LQDPGTGQQAPVASPQAVWTPGRASAV